MYISYFSINIYVNFNGNGKVSCPAVFVTHIDNFEHTRP